MNTEKLNPIKRHPALVKFSKEHHFGLLLVWKIRQGLNNAVEPERISKYLVHIFETELISHFQEEEELLLPRLSEDDAAGIRMKSEHSALHLLVSGIRSNSSDIEMLKQFASMLDDHIRFEERELFNHLQQLLSSDELDQLAEQHHTSRTDTGEMWEDRFWEYSKG